MKTTFLASLVLAAVILIEDSSAAPRSKRSSKGLTFKQQQPINDATNISRILNLGLRQDYRLQDCNGNGWKQSFPDIDYSLFGYNIFKGFPLADGRDPGFALPIFEADYSGQTHTADCRFSIPKGLVVVPDESCEISFTSKVTTSSNQLESSLSVSAKVSGGGWGASFSASAGYRKASSELWSGESVYIISSVSCTQYFSRLIPESSPKLSSIFLHWISRLQKSDNKDLYLRFFDRFGTHFPTLVTYGARFTQENKMSSQTYHNKTENGVNVAVEASYSGLFSIGGGFGMDASERQQASDFKKSVETRTVTVGASPPSNGDAMTWASTVKSSPVPVKYELDSIENVFDYLTPNTVNNITSIVDNIKRYKTSYCQELLSQGKVITCDNQNPGIELLGIRLAGIIGHYLEYNTYSECIQACLNTRDCLALSFCADCNIGETCSFVGKDSFVQIIQSKSWLVHLFTDKLQSPFIFYHTSISDMPLSIEKYSSDVDSSTCLKFCMESKSCDAFTYSNDKSSDWHCRLYGKQMITKMVLDTDSTTTFIWP